MLDRAPVLYPMPIFNIKHVNPLRTLLAVEFELAYAAALTAEGLKPASRWEKDFGEESIEALRRMGLECRIVSRTVETGRPVNELLLSRNSLFLDAYVDRFDGSRIDKSFDTQRFEGLIFGYPACCVEGFCKRPYSKNALSKEDQGLLFHWACGDCKVTPVLLPFYRNIYQALRDLAEKNGKPPDRSSC